jgi:hypothetical protein
LIYVRTRLSALECILGIGDNYATASVPLSALPGLIAGSWHHVGCTRNAGGRTDLWLDGVSVANVTSSYSPPPDGIPLSLGSDYRTPPLQQMAGAVDEVRITDHALYSTTFTPVRRFKTDTGTLALWHFDEGSGTQVSNAANPGHGTATLDQCRWVPEGTSGSCLWQVATSATLSAQPPNSTVRNGSFGGQGVAAVGGRSAWSQQSDWNQLIVPSGLAASDDVFALSADFYLPAQVAGVDTWVTMIADTGPINPNFSNGLSHRLIFSTNTNAIDWSILNGTPAGNLQPSKPAPGLASLAGQWHTFRIEGRRSTCAVRSFIDGALLDTFSNTCDLSGSTVVLNGVASVANHAANVAWTNLNVFRGSSACAP